ncbi:membrane or secreted protein [Chitinophaga sp. SYP-B3965]|uniref:membrane or secreted protein n=1 Tax=Chitinophaga sp. SYP-B3965 TaxID=2663120 RepID=UPI001299C650|nr:membrane or secreted protein [Chitinophaga sp. SYP-B3965]MRG45954.1 membrane or secreted protein [Chitinophaga sp. SYP-B3965]
MKRLSSAILLLLITHLAFAQNPLTGAWQLLPAGTEPQTIRIIEDGYFMQTAYDHAGKQFISTLGGQFSADGKALQETIEFNTADKSNVGIKNMASYTLEKDVLTVATNGKMVKWKRLDAGKAALSGTWRITGRENNGTIEPMRPGPRKTLKILSGNRFQWAAINTETKEFFGTGGGTYTFENGKYTETIAFFSRDSSRVGISLSFDGKVTGKQWHHSGKSSKGDPISEIWSRIE